MNPDIKLKPKAKRVPLGLNIHEELKTALHAEAEATGRTATEILETVLAWALKDRILKGVKK